MNYVALYRKYRPTNFDEVIGQDHIINTLRNQIVNDKISHAYLFTGTRGTGKTSTAKIFARAVNCPEAPKHNGNPCGKCGVCSAMEQPNVDIVEMDAASNNGVDYARDIREKVQYPPVSCKYKVYIIDEVHMLSTGAFNALLKTLEEPPKHAIFILCTTEVHKLPATILSRCMRFDFRLVPTDVLTNLVCRIFDNENKQYTRDACMAIAQAGEGSVRDCISIAERCYTMSQGQLTYADVMNVLGVSSRTKIASVANAVLNNNAGEVLTNINSLVNEGKDVARLSKDLAQYFRDVLVTKTCPNAKEMLCLPEDAYNMLVTSADSATTAKLLYAITTLVGLENSLRYAMSPLLLFETACLKIGNSTGEVDADGLDKRLARLEQQNNNVNADTLLVVDKTNAQSVWRGIKVELDRQNRTLFSAVWKEINGVRFEEQDNTFVVTCGKGQYNLIKMEYERELSAMVMRLCGRKLVLEQIVNESVNVDDQLNSLGDVTIDDGNKRK